MYYRISKCDVYGLKNPFLILDGWVEREVNRLELISNNKELFSIDFEATKSKIHNFSIRTALENCGLIENCQLIACTNCDRIILKKFRTTPISRFLEKKGAQELTDDFHVQLKKYESLFENTMRISDNKNYQYWIDNYEKFNNVKAYEYNPLISIIIPVYNVEAKFLAKCLDSILMQSYQNFEICIADDCSTNVNTIETLQLYARKDKRIKVIYREKNGHISEASNTALSLANGEFIGMMDNDDILAPQALNEIVRVLNQDRCLDFIYTDEDKIDMKDNRSDPQFKPDFTLEKLYGGNYICHFNVIRSKIMTEIGGFRVGYEGAQDFDLFLRISEITNRFYHIPKVLYHWRMIPGSTALNSGSKNYAGLAGKRALEDLFEKKNKNVQVDIVIHTHYYVEYIVTPEPDVEIVAFVKDNIDEFIVMCENLKKNLAFENFTMTIITESVNDIKRKLKSINNLTFNIVALKNNFINTLNVVLQNSKSEYLLFLDEYSKINTFNAIEQMVGYGAQENIGAVGCKILDKNGIVVVDSGYYLNQNHLFPLYHAAYRDDYGIYGTLLVPNGFRIIEPVCFLIKIDKIKKLNYFNSNLDLDDSFFDMFLRLDKQGFKNIVLPRVEVSTNKEIIHSINKENLINYWHSEGFETECDYYYNQNVSSKISFRFDK